MNYVIIVGASIENLGAESMTCIAIERAKQMIPDGTIILASTDKKGMQGKIKYQVINYKFPTITRWHKNKVFGIILEKYCGEIIDPDFEKKLVDTKLIIDISGYAFTTKFSLGSIYGYLNRIFLAKKLKIPYIIYSQSFGPIDIENRCDRFITNFYIRKLLQYPSCLEVREKKGYEILQKFRIKNLFSKPDMVLLHREKIDYSLLRKEISFENLIDKRNNKVAIIPNEKIICKTKYSVNYIQILNHIIKFLKLNNYIIYIVVHCHLDKKICNELVLNFGLDVEYLDCTEQGSYMFDSIVEKFDFIIASRYHSIVHGYRHNIPALVIGWEEKYNELLRIMNQTQYGIDCRENFDIYEVMKKLELLINNEKEERKILKKSLFELRIIYGEY